MRCLRRNKQKCWYAKYLAGETAYDEYGNEAGRTLTYTKPVRIDANVSPARDVNTVSIFGTDINYDKVLCMDSAPFDEKSLLWIDTKPVLNADGETSTPPDYVVKRIAESLNSVLVAVSKVDTRYV